MFSSHNAIERIKECVGKTTKKCVLYKINDIDLCNAKRNSLFTS